MTPKITTCVRCGKERWAGPAPVCAVCMLQPPTSEAAIKQAEAVGQAIAARKKAPK